jgi:predicted ATPase
LEGAVARTDIQEKGSKTPTPGLRLSDGTLKLLCLMAVLLHPRPPALICIEEPELGLHPDSMMIVANALREASKRCQVLVTTHSAELVSWFSSSPETVVVCEREPGEGTQFNRLKPNTVHLKFVAQAVKPGSTA